MTEFRPSPLDRTAELADAFLDMAGDSPTLKLATLQYLRDEGGSVRLLLGELDKRLPPTEQAIAVQHAREAYMETLLDRPAIRHKAEWREDCEGERETYKRKVVEGLAQVVDARTPQEMLDARQLPSIIRAASFKDGRAHDMPTFAANNLYLLVDTALREHVARRTYIDEHAHSNWVSKVAENRTLRLTLAAGVFVASLKSELHFIPLGNGATAQDVQHGLEALTAGLFCWEVPEELRWRGLDIIHARRTHKLQERLNSSPELADLADRIAVSAARYPGHSKPPAAAGRNESEVKAEGLSSFKKLDEEFRHFNNDPGGKPYTGNQVLGYAARLLLERRPQVEAILSPGKPASERKQLYMQLADDILTEDLARLEKGFATINLPRLVMRIAGVVPAVLFPHALATASDATSQGIDVNSVGRHHRDSES